VKIEIKSMGSRLSMPLELLYKSKDVFGWREETASRTSPRWFWVRNRMKDVKSDLDNDDINVPEYHLDFV